ncbi:type VI secretion system protein TssA [Pseudomonas chlororaphis]|uniref:type VI secretion system protein TssA n=1 Tax=Pseudomonas chlororaphis TaxID=587753 RepID=UPI001CA3BE7D|nr:type VI secretion system protein TssA [Pseudomonas chlororaphis]UQS88640.1 type VI secretion system protein TssA [Pseudomonas chlororaphis subsp. piscium]WMI97464.1 type VI secretion system protein TssA [Pseudomonas chlororaphis subsp. aurantiaca]
MEITSVVDVQHLLETISPDSPCGGDLEYDAAFLELERAAQGQPERQMGDSVLPATPPEWRQVRDLCVELFKRSKDLRIANYFLQSAIALQGLPGLVQGLQLIQQLLAQYWDNLHPKLDAEDGNDPTFRINALAGLNAEPVIHLLWGMPLLSSRAFGSVGLRAALNAAGLQRFASESLSSDQLGAAFQDCAGEQLEACRAALNDAHGTLLTIEREVNERVGSNRGADLGTIKQLLRHAVQIIAEHAPAPGVSSAVAEAGEPVDAAMSTASAAAPPRIAGEIGNRDDVLRSLDRILSYYTRHEPSSPVPVLLSRAKSLVSADFATIVSNLIPDGFSQFEKLRGPEGQQSE